MIREFEDKVKYAVSLVKLLTPQEKLEAVTIWNTFSSEFQSVIDSTVGKNPPVGFGKYIQKQKPPDTSESLDLSLPVDRHAHHFLNDPDFAVPQAEDFRGEQQIHAQNRPYDSQIVSPESCDRLNLDDLVNQNDLCSATGFSSVDNLDAWEDLLAPPPFEERDKGEPPRPSVITDNRPPLGPEHRPKGHSCSVCQTSFASKEQLNEHLKVHANEKPFACIQCNAQYRQLSSLKRHMAGHDGIKNFECPICKKRFAEKKTMLTHQRIHTGERPYLCGECGTSFAQQATLSNHELVHHKGVKKFSCQLCPSTFSSKGKLEGHMNKHCDKREFKCEYCPIAFYSRDDRSRHQKTHINPKRHQCDKCKQFFRRSEYLRKHFDICPKKPESISCVHCSKGFSSTSLHARHISRCALKDHPAPGHQPLVENSSEKQVS